MSVKEWRGILSAAWQVLPRCQKQLASPDEVDLRSFLGTTAGKILTAVLTSFSAQQTYSSNRRYLVKDWISLARDFYDLAPYVVPPKTLGFAYDLLELARKTGDDSLIEALSIVVRSEPMLVRQVAAAAELEHGVDR